MYELKNKPLMYAQGLKLCLDFCELNGIPHPRVHSMRARRDVAKAKRLTYGWYRRSTKSIQVYVELCKPASKSPYAWTWPGYTADLTPIGVMAHELGHHWHYFAGNWSWTPMHREYDSRVRGFEHAVTSYCRRNTGECIAEAFKVYVTNPTLLLALFPHHYAFFWRLGLKPVVTRHWSEVLAGSCRHLTLVKHKIELLRDRGASFTEPVTIELN